MLKDRQLQAIDLLVAGWKGEAIEKEVGVSHSQLHRWKKEPEFRVRWESERAEQHQGRVDQLWHLAEHAISVANECLTEGDPRMAIDILKLVAPGLVDVRRNDRDRKDQPGELQATSELVERPVAREAPLLDDGHRCLTCGRDFMSAGALGSHRRSHREPR